MSSSCNSIKSSFFKSLGITLGFSLPEKKSQNFATSVRTRSAGSEMPRTALFVTINAAPSGSPNGCKIIPNINQAKHHPLPLRLRVSVAPKRFEKICD